MAPDARLVSALSHRYVIERQIGRGGAATVYLAHDLKLSRRVAVKVLDTQLANSVGSERFLREIRTTAGLSHPHILTLHDSGEAAGTLFYVLPYVAGESLRDKLQREGSLSVDDAIALTLQLVDALEHAHGKGIVHRDIKPENILFASPRHACLADFGLATALGAATDQKLTVTGVTMGSPLYMSPEQATGESGIDGRTDLYSLGCVLYEMLAGEPPFRGGNVQAVITRHLMVEAPGVRRRRPEVPPHIEAAIRRAMAKSPDGRFGTARELGTALGGIGNGGQRVTQSRGRVWPGIRERWPLIGALFVVVAAFVAVQIAGLDSVRQASAAGLDSTRVAVFPLETNLPASQRMLFEQHLRGALTRWLGITVVDAARVREVLADSVGAGVQPDDANQAAQRLGAGKFVLGSLTAEGDRTVVRLTLAVTGNSNGSVIQTIAILPDESAKWDSVFMVLADRLLFDTNDPIDGSIDRPGTVTPAARRAFGEGHRALAAWDLAAADSAFSRAWAADEDYSQAALWLAQVRAWRRLEPAQWRFLVHRLVDRPTGLSGRQRESAVALLALGNGDYESMCQTYQGILEENSRDFIAWFGLGECLARDGRVVSDPASPSGWSFRSSYQGAVLAYRRAFQLAPSMLRVFSDGGFDRLRTSFHVNRNRLRAGYAADSTLFLAYANWQRDSLAFVPWPAAIVHDGDVAQLAPNLSVAVARQRQLFDELTTSWITASPDDAHALEARSVALEMLGRPGALEALQRARIVAKDQSHSLRLAAAEVWLRVKLGLPDDSVTLRRARALADSLLALPGAKVRADAGVLASVAALTGRAHDAAQFAQWVSDPAWAGNGWPDPVIRSAQSLLVFSALGGPADSIGAWDRRLQNAITSTVPAASVAAVSGTVRRRARLLAFPRSVSGESAGADPLAQAQAAITKGDEDGARSHLLLFDSLQANTEPSDRALDMLVIQAELLIALGDTSAARMLLDRTLEALPYAPPQFLGDFVAAAALHRAVRARSRIAGSEPARPGGWRFAAAILSVETG